MKFYFVAPLAGIVLGYLIYKEPSAKQKAKQEDKFPTKKCAFCAESIKIEAKVCRYCGRDVLA